MRFVVLVVLASCESKTAELEARIEKLELQRAHERVVADRFAEVYRVLHEAGVLVEPSTNWNYKLAGVGRWWCAMRCARSRDECLKMFDRDRHMSDVPGSPVCEPRRVAFCDENGRCLRRREECQTWSGEKARCFGVE